VFVAQLAVDLQDQPCPIRSPAARPHDRALAAPDRRLAPLLAHNAPTEAINILVKRIQRVSVNRGRGDHRFIGALA
jgi:hypothetical protein